MKGFLSLVKKIGVIILLLAIAIFIFLNMANYSSGFRAGVPTKLSKKGLIIKTAAAG